MSTNLIEVRNLKKYYTIKKPTKVDGKIVRKHVVKAVDDISFSMQEGETVGVIGESGCGKTTLGRVLVALERETAGEVRYNGKSSAELLKQDRLGFHRMCQMVFQNPFETFDARERIAKILMDPLKLHKIGANEEERMAMCIKALEEGGLTPAEHYLHRYPHELSGGQLQRVSIIRAMLLKPKFLVADEPVSMLDVSIRGEIIKMLQEMTEKEKTTLIFISHDIATTRYISDRIIVMYYGKIVEEGKTKEVLTHPQHDYTKLLISAVASVDPRKAKRRLKKSV
ncbi:MAG: ATP-binding cassette domain-containing protein [Erysipelotrichaceae bacterium]|jgi:peptide/nickel transport system ATP-binding protein|nr:ATP-binding cassette domain-containing protein [Erysipelotrichaceae bacterium]